MRFLRRPSWRISENDVTPESVFLNRRAFLAAAGIGGTGLALGMGGAGPAGADQPGDPFRPTPMRNPAFATGPNRSITDESITSEYNNFYEFGSHKRIWRAAQRLQTDDWRVTIDGLVERPVEIAMDDLISRMPIEERIYRHRCVEAWSMVAPWTGFELRHMLNLAGPLSSAKYVRFETFQDPSVAREQRRYWYPWPYTEGLTVAEAAHPLTFMVVGAYGKVLPKQFGAPIRLHVPWKYGFKSAKSLVRITLTDERPVSFWEELQNREYGFWANVNPAVSHPRWSQATERVLGRSESDRIATLPFNGYAEQVAGLYSGLASEGDALYR